MADENAKIDDNMTKTLLAVTDDSNAYRTRLLVDSTSKGLKTVVSSGSLSTVSTVTTVGTVTTVSAISSGTVNASVGATVKVTTSVTRPNDLTTYTAGDIVSNGSVSGSAITFSNCARVTGGAGMIINAMIASSNNATVAGSFELWMLDTIPGAQNDNVAVALTDGENNNVVSVIPIDTSFVGNSSGTALGNRLYQSEQVNRGFQCLTGSKDLYGVLVVRNAYVPVNSEVFSVRLSVLQD